VEDIAGRIAAEVLSWDGVTVPFERAVRDMLVETGRALPHHVLPESGWVSRPIRDEDDVAEAIELFRLSYERAKVAAAVAARARAG
jgi:hypothetical protein